MRVYVLYSKKKERKKIIFMNGRKRDRSLMQFFGKQKKSELQFMRTIIKDTK